MGRRLPIKTLFLDVGGVLLTDGWDHHARKRAAAVFKLELAPMEERHHLIFETFEEGKVTLDDYLRLVVFFEVRPFTRAQFRRFMFAQSRPHTDMLDLVGALRARHGLKVVVVKKRWDPDHRRRRALKALLDPGGPAGSPPPRAVQPLGAPG